MIFSIIPLRKNMQDFPKITMYRTMQMSKLSMSCGVCACRDPALLHFLIMLPSCTFRSISLLPVVCSPRPILMRCWDSMNVATRLNCYLASLFCTQNVKSCTSVCLFDRGQGWDKHTEHWRNQWRGRRLSESTQNSMSQTLPAGLHRGLGAFFLL